MNKNQIIIVAVLAVAALVVIISVSVAVSGGGVLKLNENNIVRNGNGHIALLLDNGVLKNEDIELAFVSAADRWNRVLEGTVIGSFVLPSGLEPCGEDRIKVAGDFFSNFLTIGALVIDIDGVDGILGQAGPCIQLLESAGGFPVVGFMEFDEADLEILIDEGTLNDVILHEMGHVLGIGTLWIASVQGAITLQLQDPSLLANPAIIINAFGQIVDTQTEIQPTFVGNAAVAEFGTLTEEVEVGAPVEDGLDEDDNIILGAARLEDTAGSTDGHFEQEVFGDALMTFSISAGVAHPLTRMSIASLQDLGYTVNLDEADNFELEINANVGKSAENRGKTHYFGNDILSFPNSKRIGVVGN